MEFLELDGSHGEGGGAILRQSLAMSIATGMAFRIKNIRKGRCRPGLAPQHLACVNAAKELCNAEVKGHFIGSTEISFKPSSLKPGRYKIDIGTAGSITLLLQSVLLPVVMSEQNARFVIRGGTDVKWSQPFDYFKFVYLPQLRRYADIDANLFRRGYYPKGQGEVKVIVQGKDSAGFEHEPVLLIDKKNLLQIRGVSHASHELETARVAERQAESARLELESLNVPVSIKTEYANSRSMGSGITLWAVYGDQEIDFSNPVILGADSLGDKGRKAELVGREAAQNLLRIVKSDAAVDPYLADQLIPFMAFAGGIIKASEITNHVKSNIYVAEKFTSARFEIKDNIISCELKPDAEESDVDRDEKD